MIVQGYITYGKEAVRVEVMRVEKTVWVAMAYIRVNSVLQRYTDMHTYDEKDGGGGGGEVVLCPISIWSTLIV